MVFVTLTPDYIVPELLRAPPETKLKNRVLAFDMNMGCSGFMYGLQVASSLIDSGAARRVLLVTPIPTPGTFTRAIARRPACLARRGGHHHCRVE